MSWSSQQLSALGARLSSSGRRSWRVAVAVGHWPSAAGSMSRGTEPDADLSGEWIQLGAYIERTAPHDVSAEELDCVEDAAAERIFQRSRRGGLAG